MQVIDCELMPVIIQPPFWFKLRLEPSFLDKILPTGASFPNWGKAPVTFGESLRFCYEEPADIVEKTHQPVENSEYSFSITVFLSSLTLMVGQAMMLIHSVNAS